MMRSISGCQFISLFTLLLASASASQGATAAFSEDGDFVYLSGSNLPAGALVEVNLTTLTTRQRKFDPPVRVVGLCSGRHGLFLVSDDALYHLAVPYGAPKKMCDAPAACKLQDVAFNPQADSILLVAKDSDANDFSAWYLEKQSKNPKQVNCRRVRALVGAVFDREGHLFFGSGGDLWAGEVDTSDEAQGSFPATVASRFGPVAELETQNTSPASTGVYELAVAGQTVYGHMQRIGGSGWGSIMSVHWQQPKSMAPPVDVPANTVPEYIDRYRVALAGFRSYGQNAQASYLCGSPDGSKVFFAIRQAVASERGNEKPGVQFYLGDAMGKVRLLPGLTVDPDQSP